MSFCLQGLAHAFKGLLMHDHYPKSLPGPQAEFPTPLLGSQSAEHTLLWSPSPHSGLMWGGCAAVIHSSHQQVIPKPLLSARHRDRQHSGLTVIQATVPAIVNRNN